MFGLRFDPLTLLSKRPSRLEKAESLRNALKEVNVKAESVAANIPVLLAVLRKECCWYDQQLQVK